MTTSEHIIQSKVPGKFDSYLPNYTKELCQHYQEVSSRLNTKTAVPISCSDSPISVPIKRLGKPKPDIVALPSVIMPTCTDVLDTVIHHYNVSYYDLTGPNRSPIKNAWIRQIAMWLCCRLTGESNSAIARLFNRDHTTIMHGRDLVQGKYERDPKVANELIDVIMKCFQEARASLGS